MSIVNQAGVSPRHHKPSLVRVLLQDTAARRAGWQAGRNRAAVRHIRRAGRLGQTPPTYPHWDTIVRVVRRFDSATAP